jgi:hypothetical protein
MIIVAIRETFVLMLGCLLSFIGSLMLGNANRDFTALASAILLPILFCLIRAALVKRPGSTLSGIRHVGYQLCLGFALVLLLLFEMSVGLFLGAADIPTVMWIIVAAFGMGYVFFFTVASRVGSTTDLSYNWSFACDVDRGDSNALSNRYADEQNDARETSAQPFLNSYFTPRSP